MCLTNQRLLNLTTLLYAHVGHSTPRPSPLVSATVPKKLTSITLRSTAISVSMTLPRELTPALFTRMSMWPNASNASCAFPAMDAASLRSRESIFGE